MKPKSFAFSKLFPFLLFFTFLIITMSCCKSGMKDNTNSTSNDLQQNTSKNTPQYIGGRDDNKKRFYKELIVWKKPGTNNVDFTKYFSSLKKKIRDLGTLDTVQSCMCADSFMLLTGKGVEIYMQQPRQVQGGSTTSTPNTTTSGDDGPAYWSANLEIKIPDFPINRDPKLENTPRLVFPSPNNPPGSKVVVAVFDTGLDLSADSTDGKNRLIKSLYKSSRTSCFGNIGNNGWNFANNNADWKDDHASKHGTIVSRFLVDQVYAYAKNDISLLPVKVLDNSGKGDLFKFLCGIAYAKERSAKIVNSSLGFYADRNAVDSTGLLLGKFVEYYLAKNNILLVAAAGNAYDPFSDAGFRNLENINFYPASLARDFKNVIAVTTINKTQVATNQNHSANVVDIGVRADRDADFVFQHPIHPLISVIGSSFACPVATGKLTANYSQIQGVVGSGKSSIWSSLGANITAPKGIPEVKDGRATRKRQLLNPW